MLIDKLLKKRNGKLVTDKQIYIKPIFGINNNAIIDEYKKQLNLSDIVAWYDDDVKYYYGEYIILYETYSTTDEALFNLTKTIQHNHYLSHIISMSLDGEEFNIHSKYDVASLLSTLNNLPFCRNHEFHKNCKNFAIALLSEQLVI